MDVSVSTHPKTESAPGAGLPRLWIVILGIVILLAFAAGYGLFRHERRSVQQQVSVDLKTVAELKINQIVSWRNERIGDVRVAAASPNLQAIIPLWLRAPEDTDLKGGIIRNLHRFVRYYGYADALLAGADGRFLLSLNLTASDFDDYMSNIISRAVSSRDVVFGDIHRCADCKRVYLDIAAPVFDSDGIPMAAIILRVNPGDYLYPLVQWWPTSSHSAETLLLRQEGDRILFLNKLRHRPAPALTISFPLSKADLPAAKAAQGQEGPVEGKDYRGVKVLAYIRPIPASSWFMVSKIDMSEINAEVHALGLTILLFLILFIVLGGVVVAFVFNYRQRNLYTILYETEKERRESEEINRATLYSIGDGVISTDIRGRVRQMNPVAERLTGWTEAEALGKNIAEVFRIVNEESRAEFESPVVQVLRNGVVVGLANHTLLIARDGVERPIADAGAPIRDARGEISGVVLVFRDQTDERRAQKALRESERKFRETILYLDEGYYSCTMEGLLLEHNLAFNRILGFAPEEDLKGTKLPDFWQSPENRQDYLNRLTSNGVVNNYLVPAKTVGGEAIVVMASAHLVKDEQGQTARISGTILDITDRMRVEEALRESEHQFRLLFDNSVSGIVVFEAIFGDQGSPVDFYIRDANPSVEKHLGLSVEKLVGRRFSKLVPDLGEAPLFHHLSRAVQTGENLSYELHNKWLDRYSAGNIYRIEGSHFAVVFEDITDRKRDEEALRRHRDELEVLVKERSEQLYLSEQRLAQESAAVAEIIGEMLNGQLSDEETERQVLNACLEATGSVYGLIGRINEQGKFDTTAYGSQSVDDCAFPEALTWEMTTGMDVRGIWGWPLQHGEPLICNDLTTHPARVGLPEGHVPLSSFLGVPILGNGRANGLVAVANRPGGYTEADVGTLTRLVNVMTVSKRHRGLLAEAKAFGAELEQRVRERTIQLETVNKELEAFAYSVSHDLRAPLRSLDGFSAALLANYPDQLDEKGRHYLDRIQAASRRMGQLINDLLGLSRISRREFTSGRVDLTALARQVANETQAQEPERRAEIVIAEGMACQGDAHLLRVVLENLMGNAWKFTATHSPSRIEVGMVKQDGEDVFFVRDNGVGFDMAYADKLFSPFQRLHAMEEFPGTGIGLATVQRVIQRHGGRIWPEAAEDRGATFFFTLGGDGGRENYSAG